jgi:hypothetical protein
MRAIRPTTVWLLVSLSFAGTVFVAATLRIWFYWRFLGWPLVPGFEDLGLAMLAIAFLQAVLVIGLDRCSHQQLVYGFPEATRACLQGVRFCALSSVVSAVIFSAPLVWHQYTLLPAGSQFSNVLWVNLDRKVKQTPPGLLLIVLVPLPIFCAFKASSRLRRLPALFRAMPGDRGGRVLWYLLNVASDRRVTDERLVVFEPDEKLILPGLDHWLTTKRLLAFTSIDPVSVEAVPRAEIVSLTWHARERGVLACVVKLADGRECLLPSFEVDDCQHDFVLLRDISAGLKRIVSCIPLSLRRRHGSAPDSNIPVVEGVIEGLFSGKAPLPCPEARELLANAAEDDEEQVVAATPVIVLTTKRVIGLGEKKRVKRSVPLLEGTRVGVGNQGLFLGRKDARTVSFDLRMVPPLTRVMFIHALVSRPEIESVTFA